MATPREIEDARKDALSKARDAAGYSDRTATGLAAVACAIVYLADKLARAAGSS